MNKKFAFTFAEGATHVAMPPVFSKAGFTLAEVLITLGVIGVVAAITIPELMTAYKAHQLRSQFLKSYSVVQQVFKQMESEDIAIEPSAYTGVYGPQVLLYKEFKKFFSCILKYHVL